MRISDWSSDVCSSDLNFLGCRGPAPSSRSGAPKLSAYIPSIRSVSSSVSASNSLSRARREAPLILGEEFAQELDLGGRHVDQLLHCSVEGVERLEETDLLGKVVLESLFHAFV